LDGLNEYGVVAGKNKGAAIKPSDTAMKIAYRKKCERNGKIPFLMC